ncbi:response regulator [Thiolapillus sp.]|nr:response regulator [Thiolapillus sp.]
MKVLLVDDSKAARFAMGKLLKDQGLEVEMAASGEEALDKIATEAIDIVFMDQSMPGMGGIAATTAITSNEKNRTYPGSTLHRQ